MTTTPYSVDITNDDISGISSYIKSKNTAVLTVMFTDIKGFVALTETLGEEQAKQIRLEHDDIMRQVIERDNDGLIVKYIGDAVMAIFSEPSAAVSRAVEIQQQIRLLNERYPSSTDIAVRIGMHMGQVSVEDDVKADVFGSHVNRAARIESLADGGQIFLTYPVFDSAKGWLKNLPDIHWQLHGKYLLKGMKEGTEIYEVYDHKIQQPKPPKNAEKQTSMPKTVVAAALLVLGFALAMLMTFVQKTETWLLDFYPQQVVVNNNTLLELEGQAGDQSRLVKTELTQGTHQLYYQISDGIRYYASIDIGYGKNKIKPKFEEYRLPALTNRLTVNTTAPEASSKQSQRTVDYVIFTNDGEALNYSAELTVTSSAERSEDKIVSDVFPKLVVNNKQVTIDPLRLEHSVSAKKAKRTEPSLLFEDEYHAYYLDYSLYRSSVTVSLRAQYKPNPLITNNY